MRRLGDVFHELRDPVVVMSCCELPEMLANPLPSPAFRDAAKESRCLSYYQLLSTATEAISQDMLIIMSCFGLNYIPSQFMLKPFSPGHLEISSLQI